MKSLKQSTSAMTVAIIITASFLLFFFISFLINQLSTYEGMRGSNATIRKVMVIMIQLIILIICFKLNLTYIGLKLETEET